MFSFYGSKNLTIVIKWIVVILLWVKRGTSKFYCKPSNFINRHEIPFDLS